MIDNLWYPTHTHPAAQTALLDHMDARISDLTNTLKSLVTGPQATHCKHVVYIVRGGCVYTGGCRLHRRYHLPHVAHVAVSWGAQVKWGLICLRPAALAVAC